VVDPNRILFILQILSILSSLTVRLTSNSEVLAERASWPPVN
jgi:hypothetical protein